jgi:hypothetical protein
MHCGESVPVSIEMLSHSSARTLPWASSRSRAHSSIGQSPRLITGLFLVRTQVGPLSTLPRVLLLSAAVCGAARD